MPTKNPILPLLRIRFLIGRDGSSHMLHFGLTALPRARLNRIENCCRSGIGVARPGFDRLLTAVGRGEVGAVFAIEASRLARNGRDWHTLLEFCAIVGTLIIDEDGVYDPRSSNDQMMLGLKLEFPPAIT